MRNEDEEILTEDLNEIEEIEEINLRNIGISDKVARLVQGTPVGDNKAELIRLGKLDPKRQLAIAEKLATSKAKTIYEAGRLVDGYTRVAVKPGVQPPGERFIELIDKVQVKVGTLGIILGNITLETAWAEAELVHFRDQLITIANRFDEYIELFDRVLVVIEADEP